MAEGPRTPVAGTPDESPGAVRDRDLVPRRASLFLSRAANPCDASPRGQPAFATAEAYGEHFWEAELHRRRGRILLAQSRDNRAAAEACYRQAIEVAKSQEARLLELRAATSLAGLWREDGKGDLARDLLAPVHGWFTEGFDTADLKEAKALLDELA